MRDDVIKERLERIFFECDKHLERMQSAARHMLPLMPLDAQRYEKLTDEEIAYIDQFLFRFAKLQDAIGQKLFRTLLAYLGEEVENKPFRDILALLEKLELLESAYVWQELREYRNALAHDYESEPESMSEHIFMLYEKRETLTDIYLHLKRFYDSQKSRG